MGVYDKYYNQVKKSQEKSLAEDVAATEKMHDTQKQTVEENYNTQIADTEVSYEDAFKSNDVQRQLNERYLERKAAELGLTDSGMSRTQQTAVQLSHANQRGSLNAQKQKAIDTLAQTMRAKIVEIENSKTASVQQIKSSYDNEARTQATSMYNSYLDSQAKIQAARITAADNKTKAANEAYDRLFSMAVSGDYSDEALKASMEGHAEKYGMTLSEAQRILDAAGITDFKVVENQGMLEFSENGDDQKNGKEATSTNFKKGLGGNFTITVDKNSYAVENQGKVSDDEIKQNIAASKAYGDVRYYNGKVYYKNDNDYYEVGPREGFLNVHWGGERDFDKLKNDLFFSN